MAGAYVEEAVELSVNKLSRLVTSLPVELLELLLVLFISRFNSVVRSVAVELVELLVLPVLLESPESPP